MGKFDIYAILPCERITPKESVSAGNSELVNLTIDHYNEISKRVLYPKYQKVFSRFGFPVEIILGGEQPIEGLVTLVDCSWRGIDSDLGDISKFCSITIRLPNVGAPEKVLFDIVFDQVKVNTKSGEQIELVRWLETIGYSVLGTAKFCVFSEEAVNDQNLKCILACQPLDSGRSFTSEYLDRRSKLNIAQFSSASIFASRSVLFEVQPRSGKRESDILFGQLATVFICEIQVMKIAVLAFLDSVISKAKQDPFNIANEELGKINLLFAETQQLLRFNHYRRLIARELASRVEEAFDLETQESELRSTRKAFEELISVIQLQISERENKSINNLLIFLAVLQVLPVIFSVWMAALGEKIEFTDILSGLLSSLTCAGIFLIFKTKWRREKQIKSGRNMENEINESQ